LASEQLSELVDLALSGNKEAFERIYEATANEVYRTLYLLSGSTNDAEDIAQNVYLEFYRCLDRYDRSRPLSGWLHGIALRQLQAHKRKRWREFRKERKAGIYRLAEESFEEPDANTRTALSLSDLDGLPDKYKRVLRLKYFEDLSQQEIADAVGLPLGTVKSRLSQALAIMRHQMQRDKPDAVRPPGELRRKVMEQIEMRNENGDTLATLRVDSIRADDALDAIIRTLRPGMGKAIYVSGTTDRTVSQQTHYEAVKWNEGIRALLDRAAPLRLRLPGDAEWREVRVYYGFDNASEEEIEEMIAESERFGKKVVVRDLRPNGQLVGVNLGCVQDGRAFEFRIFKTTKSRVHVPDIGKEEIGRLRVRGHEAVYLQNDGRRQLIWAEPESGSGKVLQYELHGENLGRDEMIRIAESATEADLS